MKRSFDSASYPNPLRPNIGPYGPAYPPNAFPTPAPGYSQFPGVNQAAYTGQPGQPPLPPGPPPPPPNCEPSRVNNVWSFLVYHCSQQ